MNKINLAGVIKSTRAIGSNSYIDLSVKRRSGVSDVLPVLVSSDTTYQIGDRVKLEGKLSGKHEGGHLSLVVVPTKIEVTTSQQEPINAVSVYAKIARLNPQKVAMLNKSLLIDGLLALPATEDYIPFVAWGTQVEIIQEYAENHKMLPIVGRMQSRQYTKDSKTRMVYELSISSLANQLPENTNF